MYSEKVILFLQVKTNYEIISNMNDYIDLSEISRFTDLRIGCKNVGGNIYSIMFPIDSFDMVLRSCLENDYIVVVMNSHDENTDICKRKLYNIYF
jgi:hypothetical protein